MSSAPLLVSDVMYDATYSVNSEDYSPETDYYVDAAEAVPEIHTHGRSPLDCSSNVPAAFVPRPPDPAVGGKPGMTNALGWSTGIRLSRAFRQPFGGQTLVVPTMGVHPIEGPVGFSTRTDRLVYNADALTANDTPTDAQVSAAFADPNVASIAYATGMNPNYV